MTVELLHIIVEGAVVPVIALIGWLLARLIRGVDDKVSKIDTKVDANILLTGEHAKTLAVHEFRLNSLQK